MKKIVSVSTMRMSDSKTIEKLTNSKELMQRAGEAIFESVDWFGKVAIICGKGNNAGDGFVLASLLKKQGICVQLILLYDKFSTDGEYFFNECKANNVDICKYDSKTDLNGKNFIVDCIFGTGFCGQLDYLAKEVINKINNSFAQVVSIDINSGLNGDNGCCETAVKSALTISIGFYKTGHFLGNAKSYIKKIINKNIGIELFGESYNLIELSDLKELFPLREACTNKGNFGYVGILGGCLEYSGAVKLANLSLSALKSGCGVSKLIVPNCIAVSVSPYLLESTLFGLPDKNGKMIFDSEQLCLALDNLKSLAIGMGWGESEEYKKILEFILTNYSIPLIIDADGLNTLSKMDKDILKTTKCKVILTPHLKEFERLSGKTVDEIKKNPIELAIEFANKYNVVLLLKGSTTIVTDGKTVYLTSSGSSGMATAGSGDVLCGILAGLLGFSKNILLAVAGGALINGLAGERAEKKINAYSMLSSDTVSEIANVISDIIKE